MAILTWEGSADEDVPNFCPQGCGGISEDPYGGPCQRCWDAVDAGTMTEAAAHDLLVWGPAAGGERAASGQRMPAGWVWTCSCGESGAGLASEDAADDAGEEHYQRTKVSSP